ncbi:unnamed protein product [Lactuca virosa]|uniref:Uncharacterized protein n=1 Tax=Lactuca virosa TaxID=75947 RepID=A0AAU9P3A7_9ASTR|nr:unnamed protein product [Lactuca virosa]
MSPHRIRIVSESEFSHPVIILDAILEKLDENSASLRSYQKYIQGTTLSPKKKRKHSDHASKKSAKKKKRLNSDQPPSIPPPVVSNDNLGVDLDEPTSPSKFAPVSPAGFQSVLESPSNRVSLDYDSFEDDDQDGEKQSELEDLPKISTVKDNQDEDTPMQTVDIPSSEGLIVDDESHDMSIVLYSKPSTMTFNIDLNDYSPLPQK